ncbi:MAG: glycoside hydrolase family 13 protein [Eubacteriales bacterium]
MNKLALFCDGTRNYVNPAEPKAYEKITLRFRTARKDVDHVWLVVKSEEIPMSIQERDGIFDYYSVEWHMTNVPFLYCFKVQKGEEILYYNRFGMGEKHNDHYRFRIVPGFSTPAWAKGAVIYQIFVDRFYNGDQSNDVVDREYYYIGDTAVNVTDWNKMPANMGIREFYGGDLQGVMDKLDYLQDLGVEALYFNPIFVSPSNHKYDIQDYDYVDPHYGRIVKDGGEPLVEGDICNEHATKYQVRTTAKENLEASNQLLIELVEELHRRGMKLILDGVFNHCGSFNKWLDRERIYESQDEYEKGAYTSKDSPYREFFRFFNEEDHAWPYNGAYDGWWGHDTLPKLNYEASSKLEEYILEIGRKWVSPPYNVDGWRLDVAADLGHSNEYNHEFWRKFRTTVKEANPEAIILAEHYGDPSEWLEGDEWDTVMNYDAFMEPLTWFLTGMEKHSDQCFMELKGNAQYFVNTMRHHMADMLPSSLQVAMNELSNHDHSRFLTRTNHCVGRVEHLGSAAASENVEMAVMREAVVVQMTWIGAPTVYYGDEAGVCGFTDPDNRRTYPWGNEDKELIAFHKEMIWLRRKHEVLKHGSISMLTWEKDMISYGRFTKDEQAVVVINNQPELKQYVIPVWRIGIPMNCKLKRLMYTYQDGYISSYEEYYVQEGNLYINMGGNSALVLKTIEEIKG